MTLRRTAGISGRSFKNPMRRHPRPKTVRCPANYERVAKILRGHTGFKHFFTPHPYLRMFRKLGTRAEEQRSVRLNRSPKEVLNALIAEAFPKT